MSVIALAAKLLPFRYMPVVARLRGDVLLGFLLTGVCSGSRL